ncbi:Elongation factor P [Senna tora]|uniref:Elongation factor P n=1 Tax=Senna tora TaxID=362788 RepID=A0A834X2T3_9FABA|nr:Elongation factor P [Senna tora]
MQMSKRVCKSLFIASISSPRLSSILGASFSSISSPPPSNSLPSSVSATSTATCRTITPNLLSSPWSAIQCRGLKVSGSDLLTNSLRISIVVDMLLPGRIYEVLKVDHAHEGRGKATIKVELRDIGYGNKVTQRFGTSEDVERVYVQEKNFMYMCMDHDGTVVLMDPDTLDQVELSRDLFGKNAVYLRDEMKVKVQFYDDKPLSASVPKRVTCTIKEEIAATPRYMSLPGILHFA